MPRHVRIADAEGRTDHDEPRFVSVTGSRQHVWIEDQHFQETDRDTEVGDVFYDTTGAESVYEVIAIDDSDSEQEVEIEYLYLGKRGEPGEEKDRPTDTVSLELLRGEQEPTMGEGFSPVPLEQVE